MPKEMIRYLLTNSATKRTHMQLAIQCAPLLKGIKEASIVIVPVSMYLELLKQIESTYIFYQVFYQNDKKIVLYLYRKELLELYLAKQEVRDFLEQYEYYEDRTEDLVLRLANRAEKYYSNQEEFPHEMGVFLGYPIGDVDGFIKNGGKNFLMTGYWKVYENPERARAIFTSYDTAKEIAGREVLDGKQLCEIAC